MEASLSKARFLTSGSKGAGGVDSFLASLSSLSSSDSTEIAECAIRSQNHRQLPFLTLILYNNFLILGENRVLPVVLNCLLKVLVVLANLLLEPS